MSQPSIRFVCLSDLHLGAKYSVLTKTEGEIAADQQTRQMQTDLSGAAAVKSPTLKAFAAALTEFLEPGLPESQRPTLVLLGDVLDLSFSDWYDAVGTFSAFIDSLFPESKNQDDPSDGWVFAKEILLIPGNHDHQLWKTVKDRRYSDLLSKGDNPERFMQITNLFDKPTLDSDLLTSIVKALPNREVLKVVAAYPNYAVKNKERCVIFHHGHFIESTYTVMSDLGDWLFRLDAPPTSETLEARNGPWINFGWSSLGSAGVANESEREYLTMQDPAASHVFIKRLARKMISYFSGGVPASSGDISDAAPGVTINGIVMASLDFAIGKASATERNSFMSVLGPSSVKGLKSYLTGPVYRQLVENEKDGNAMYELETTFIFGHTHKPFQDRLITRHFRLPVNVFNTGGWVLDLPKKTSAQGTAAVFVDEDLNVASLRLFNVPLNGAAPKVFAAGTGGYPDTVNPLLKRLQTRLESEPEWDEFSRAFLKAIEHRAEVAANYNFDPTLNPPVESAANPPITNTYHGAFK